MGRERKLLALLLAPAAFAAATLPVASRAQGATPVKCARVVEEKAGPGGILNGCWTQVEPYPFGSNGEAVNPANTSECTTQGGDTRGCYLTVTSMAFRAWNRGLAATALEGSTEPGRTSPFGVWIFNGVRWFPNPSFPGKAVCPGHTILWAGKLDYWLVGATSWGPLCRFNGATNEWTPLNVPSATLARESQLNGKGELETNAGRITSGACFAFNNCTFFGTNGVVLDWDGKKLVDASPDLSNTLVQGEYTAATTATDASGDLLGAAIGASGESAESEVPLRRDPPAPAQMYSSAGGAFSPLAFAPFTRPLAGDPYHTDLVAVAFGPAGQGWVAGNPAGIRLKENQGSNVVNNPEHGRGGQLINGEPQPDPLIPVTPSGEQWCFGPPANRFTFGPGSPTGAVVSSFLWSSITVLPGGNEALAGGRIVKPGAQAEPVLVSARCGAGTTVTRFQAENPVVPGTFVPADITGSVTAVAATAANDAWVATTYGEELTATGQTPSRQPPTLYRLSNGQPPDEPEGDDREERPSEVTEEAPTVIDEPEAPPVEVVGPPATVTQTRGVTLPPAVYDVKVKLDKKTLTLNFTFKLRRPATVGAEALRRKRVVSKAKPRYFTGHKGRLLLKLNRKRWPTRVRLIA
jgi:hypothetical protein